MDEQELRILAAERAIVEMSAVIGQDTRTRVVELLNDELATAADDERLVLQAAVDLVKDGKLLADFLKLAGWLRPDPSPEP